MEASASEQGALSLLQKFSPGETFTPRAANHWILPRKSLLDLNTDGNQMHFRAVDNHFKGISILIDGGTSVSTKFATL